MNEPQMTLNELQAKIAKHAWEDAAFEAEFMTNPKATFEKYMGQPLPAQLAIHAHYNTPSELHFVIPARPAKDASELTDEDLERVSGGETLSLAATIFITIATSILATSAAATILQKEEGW